MQREADGLHRRSVRAAEAQVASARVEEVAHAKGRAWRFGGSIGAYLSESRISRVSTSESETMSIKYTIILDPALAALPLIAGAVQSREPWGRGRWYGEVTDRNGRVVAETDFAPFPQAEAAAVAVLRILTA